MTTKMIVVLANSVKKSGRCLAGKEIVWTDGSWKVGNWIRPVASPDGGEISMYSMMQTIQEVAKTAKQLTVFQRTPNWCAPLLNSKIDAEEMAKIWAGYPEMFQRCQETFACFLHTPDPRGTFEVSAEEREAFWEKRYAEPGFGIWQGNFRDILTDREANARDQRFRRQEDPPAGRRTRRWRKS